MVDKRFAFGVVFGGVESGNEEFLEESEVGVGGKCVVEREKGTREFEAVASEFEFVCSVDVGDEELGRGATGRLGYPHKEVLLLVLFEK